MNLVSIVLHICFLLLFMAFEIRMAHQRPLCIWNLTKKTLPEKCPYAPLLSRIPRRTVIRPGSFCSFFM